MRGLRAALYKERRLFLRSVGPAALLLPLLLLLALRLGMGDAARQIYVRPFPIAVRDEDGTVMSRSLISQMRRVQLFSQVVVPKDGESDPQLLADGAAAVITIPKDFFYDLYRMEDCPVQVTLNGEMPLEATLLRTVFCSVMDIIRSDQAAGLGLYRFLYGKLTEDQQRAMYAETSSHLIQDALGRQTVFDGTEEEADLQGALEQRLLAALLAASALFFSLSAVKTVPEERTLGVLPRYRAAGGSLPAFLLAKLSTALLAALPTLLLSILFLSPRRAGALLLVGLSLCFGAFGLLLAVASWCGGPAAAQRLGNLVVLASLVLGGALWPSRLLPGPLSLLSRLTLPYYASLGTAAACRSASPAVLLRLLWPVLLMGAAGIAVGLPGLRRRAGSPAGPSEAAHRTRPPSVPLRPVPLRLPGMAGQKLLAMSGGVRGLALLLAAALACGGAAAAVQAGGAAQLRAAVCDLDGSDLSQELLDLLSRQPGLSLVPCGDEAEGELLLLRGEVEGVLTIGRSYAAALGSGQGAPLHYTGAASAVSAQGVREIVAGQAAVQRSRLRAVELAQAQLGPLSREESDRLLDCIAQAEDAAPLIYRIGTEDGAPVPDPFLPGPMSFAALAVLSTLLTAAPWSGADGRRVARRLRSLPWGRLLACGSDWLALTALGLLTALAVLLPAGPPGAAEILAALLYAACAAALAMALDRSVDREGRVDGLAPFLSMCLCLFGGCFLDLSQLSPAFAALALLTPPGLAVEAAGGSWPALAALAAEAALFLRLAVPGRRS